jgi:hypothetical protein
MALVGKLKIFSLASVGTGTTLGASLSAGIKAVSTAALASAKGLAILSGVALALGFSVKMAAEGIATLVGAFGQVGDNAMDAILGIGAFTLAIAAMVFGMVLLAPKAAAAGAGLGILSAAVIGLGIGVKLAASGVGEMAAGFGALFASLTTDNTENFTTFITDISSNAKELAIAAAGLVLMSKGVSSLASSLSQIPTETLEKLGNLGGIGVDVEVSGATENIRAMMSAINEVNTLKLTAASLLVTAATAGNVAAAAPTGAAPRQNVPAPEVDIKVYVDGKPATGEIVTVFNNEITRRVLGR